MRPHSRPLVSAGVLAAGLFALVPAAVGQSAPDDEPLPPAMNRPTAPPPPAAPPTAPPPAALPPPAAAAPPPAAPAPAPPPPAATPAPQPEPAQPEPAQPRRRSRRSKNTTTGLETKASPPAARAAEPVVSDHASYLPSLTGQVGLYHLSTAEVGPVGHLRFGLHGQFFRSTGFLVEGDNGTQDTNTRFGGTFTFGFTPHEAIELYGAIMSSSNRNERESEVGRRDPVLIKSFGDLVLGGKAVLPVARGFTAGAELGFRFLSGISNLSVSPSSTSLWIGPIATLDLRQIADVPLRFHGNISYYLDNSSNLQSFDQSTTDQTREVAMFAYGMASSRMRFGLGVDAPLERFTGPVGLRPFAEYHAEIVTASADPAFADQAGDLRNRDMHWMTVGLRARVLQGLTLDAGIDVGLRSVGFEYGPPVPPYDLIFGLSYPFDTAAYGRATVVTKTIEKAPAPSTGTVSGTVRNKSDGKPIAEAVVSFGGQSRARVATDPDGTFQSAPLPPGTANITVAAAGFESATGKATIVVGSAATVEVALVAKVVNGNIRGKVSDRAGKPIVATIRFNGPNTIEARSDSGGTYAAVLPAGPYRVSVDAAGYAPKELPLEVTAGQERDYDLTLRQANADVTVTPTAIVLRVPIKFRAGPPKLLPAIKGELDGVADVLADHPEIKTLRIEAHWSGAAKGSAGDAAKKLTAKQAAAIKEYLVSKGAPADRIETAGMGGEAPLVPNLGPANQAKNRRVELVVVQ